MRGSVGRLDRTGGVRISGKEPRGCWDWLLVALVACGLLFYAADRMTGKIVFETGRVLGKKVEETHTGTGTKRKKVTKYYLILQTEHSHELKADVGSGKYSQFKQGDEIEAKFWVGGITGSKNFSDLEASNPTKRAMRSMGS